MLQLKDIDWPLIFGSHQEKENVELKKTANRKKNKNWRKQSEIKSR